MSEFKKLKLITERGIKSTESILIFYNGINALLDSLEKNKLHHVSINFTIQDLMTYFPNYNVDTLQYFLKKQSVKKYVEGEKTYYTLCEILSCFDFLFQSLGAPK